MIAPSFTIETERLILRRMSLEEIPQVFEATRYEGFTDGMSWNPPEHIDELIEPHERGINDWGNGVFAFSFYHKKEGLFLGRISIRKENGNLEDVWNIGYWTHPKHQGHGYMTEAVRAIIRFGFTKLNAQRIVACHMLWNIASRRVMKKGGMTFDAHIEKGIKKNGAWVPEDRYKIDKEQWENNKSHPRKMG